MPVESRYRRPRLTLRYRVGQGLVYALLLCACASQPQPPALPGPAPSPHPDGTDLVLLQPLPSPELKVKTSGTLGPARSGSSMDRGFGEYDGGLQSSLYLCGATGPAAGPCLAVMASLFAVAGATTSLVYGAQQDAQGRGETAAAREAILRDVSLAMLSERIAARAVALRTGRATAVIAPGVTDTCATAVSDLTPHAVATIDLAAMEIAFEPGYRFRLTLVARVRTTHCGPAENVVERRLAYLGPSLALSGDQQRAMAALNTEIDTATTALGREVDAYLRGVL